MAKRRIVRVYVEVNVPVSLPLSDKAVWQIRHERISSKLAQRLMAAVERRMRIDPNDSLAGGRGGRFVSTQITDVDGEEVWEQPYIYS